MKGGKTIASVLALAAVYFITAKCGLLLAVVNPSATAVWPPTGIALAALLLWGYRLWPGIFAGAFLANLLTQGTVFTSLGIATGNTLEPLLAAWLVNSFANGRKVFDRAGDIFRYILLAALASTAVSATFGVTSLCLGHFVGWGNYMPVWMTWWLGDATGAMIITPLILLWSAGPLPPLNRVRFFEALAVGGCALLVSSIGFDGLGDIAMARYIRFLLYPTVLWAAYRFGQRGAITVAVMISAIAIRGTLHGYGPFASTDPNSALTLLQTYLGALTITNLILSSVVSERRRAERAVTESEVRFRNLADSVPVMIWMTGLDKSCTYLNRTWVEFTGRPASQDLGHGWEEMVHQYDVAQSVSTYEAAFDARREFRMEYRLKRADGEYRRILSHGIPRLDANGEFVGFIGSCIDITERKQNEETLRLAHSELESRVLNRTVELVRANLALREEIDARQKAQLARERLAAIVESSSDAILSEALDGTITSWNKGAEKTLGYPAAEIIGKPVSTIIPPDRVDELNLFLERIQRDEFIEPLETLRIRKDGHPIHMLMTLSPIKDETGRVMGASAIMHDISERKRLEAEVLQVSEREQRRIAEDLHDGVGQQLGGISCLSDVLKKNLEQQASPEAAAAGKISHLLNVAMAQTRNLAHGLHPVVPETNGLMSALEDLAGRATDLFKISCAFECLEPVLIEDNTTATHLYRIAQEAISNAIKHGKARHIKIGLYANPGRIILTVDDDGIGFTPPAKGKKGLGLRIMNHRAGMIGGVLILRKKAPAGTEVICTIQKNGATATENGHGS